jgi:tetratricopeptide (TPR) repeat protein
MNQRLRRLLAAGVGAAFLVSPVQALGQARVFADGLGELTAAIAGTYGDEGARVGPAIEGMARALAEWDREILTLEAHVASAVAGGRVAGTVPLRTELARRYAERGRLSDALRELDAALTLDPRDGDAQLLRGQVLAAASRYEDAGHAFREAWSRNTGNPVAAYLLLHLAPSIERRDVEGATATLRAAYRTSIGGGARQTSAPFQTFDILHPGHAEVTISPVLYRRAYARLAGGDYADALAEFRRAAARDPLVVDPVSRSPAMRQAVAALRQGRLSEARTWLQRADGARDSSEAQRVLGLIDWADAQYDASIAELATAIRRNPLDERSRLALSRVLRSAGRDADATVALRDTLQALPDSGLAHAWLATALEQANRFDEARDEFARAIPAVTTGGAAYLATLARAAYASGDGPGTIEALRQSIAADPNDAQTHRDLARALLQQDRPDDALAELIVAVVIDPRDAGAHFGIGQIHLNAGRYEEAEAALRCVLRLVPAYTEARYALATTLRHLGRDREAAPELARVEQEQRQEIAARREALVLATMKEEAALRTAEGDYARAAALWQEMITREPNQPSHHVGLAEVLKRAGLVNDAIEQYEVALNRGANLLTYRQLADLYMQAGRLDDAHRARALYTQALQRDLTVGSAAP